MDEKPFLEVNLLDLKEFQVEEIKKFHKSYFDVDTILSSASELKYTAELKATIAREFASPSPDFVKHFGKQIYDGLFTAKILEQFTPLVKRSIASTINDVISDRLKAAVKDQETRQEQEEAPIPKPEDPKTVTTEEEIEAFYITKSILRGAIPTERITYRDAQNYFAIFVDDNNRKTVCRLYLNNPANKRLTFIDENHKEQHNKLNTIDEIYNYSDQLIENATKYL
jgi:hypothetical protein